MTPWILILLRVRNEMNFDNHHADTDRIYRLTTSIKENNWIWESRPSLLANAAKRDIAEIEKIARLHTGNLPVFNVNGNLFAAAGLLALLIALMTTSFQAVKAALSKPVKSLRTEWQNDNFFE